MSLVVLTPFRSVRSLLGYGLAVGSVLGILLITAALGLVLQQGSLVIFVAAIALTALYGGFGPGLLATILSLGAIVAFLGPGFGPFPLNTPDGQWRLVLF